MHRLNYMTCFLLLSCASTTGVKPSNETQNTYTIEGDVVTVPLPGFIQTCLDRPTIWINEATGKRKANTWLPPKGGFYLDGEFVERSMGCDVVNCQEAKNSFTKLVEYQKTGERTSPENYKSAEYKTTPLIGSLTLEFPYFEDKECKNAKTFSVTISRTN